MWSFELFVWYFVDDIWMFLVIYYEIRLWGVFRVRNKKRVVCIIFNFIGCSKQFSLINSQFFQFDCSWHVRKKDLWIIYLFIWWHIYLFRISSKSTKVIPKAKLFKVENDSTSIYSILFNILQNNSTKCIQKTEKHKKHTIKNWGQSWTENRILWRVPRFLINFFQFFSAVSQTWIYLECRTKAGTILMLNNA